MHRRASPYRLPAFVLLLAAALSFYLALHMGSDALRLAMLAKGIAVLAGAIVLFRRDDRMPVPVGAAGRHRR